ncbi:MAG: 3-isopropylmalate dehydratase large subunit [Pseudomonadota bacterium]
MAQTLYDKLWDAHIVDVTQDGRCLIYIDRHLIHEVTSPQAFNGIELAQRKLWRRDSILAVSDHNVPTKDRESGIKDPVSRTQVETLNHNCHKHNLTEFAMHDERQGIVHIIGPEQGITLPGMTIVCGDSHTSTHGALGALAFGIGTSEVEHVLVTQCLILKKSKNFLINVTGDLGQAVSAKDLILKIIGLIGTAGGTGYTIEFSGDTITTLSIEGRMTICNMAIEAGARTGLVAVDNKTIDYVEGRPFAPTSVLWDKAKTYWSTLKSDQGAVFDKSITVDATKIKPQVTWGTSPEMVVSVDEKVPSPSDAESSTRADSMKHALSYMGLKPGTAITDIKLDKVFLGSCTNSRIEDLRVAAKIVKGKKVAKNIKLAMVVPGSGLVRAQAEKEGLDKIFQSAGFEWRLPGCSMCLGMNEDQLQPKERCASTSNRNFEGRQGKEGRTHLASPAMVAAAAINGHFVDTT